MNNHKNDVLNHEKILYVIKELEQNPHLTQRDLAQKLGISLGKTNFLLRALIEKGVVEARNFKNSKNKLAYMYLLTPHGIKMKIQLTQEFFAFKLQEYERLHKEIEYLRKEASLLAPNLIEKETVSLGEK
ncbi:MAG: MarR family EPS-associated transcriptional regulator [Candidatus Omnitrophica bacterium]|nr:MarR family EPS-associated transcriptional regulator [Candidatus Omnitrophota bacterium]